MRSTGQIFGTQGFIRLFTALCLLVIAANSEAIPEQYIVSFKEGVTPADIIAHTSWVKSLRRSDIALGYVTPERGGILKTFRIQAYNCYAGIFDEETIQDIVTDPNIAYVEPNQVVSLSDIVQQADAPWGLGRISHREPSSATYVYDKKAGNGSFAYIIDSGIYTEHEDFEGRATLAYKVDPSFPDGDSIGHGTHVAGIVGSKTYGVAKQVQLIGVKVFSGESGSTSDVIDGIEWAVNDITSKNRTAVSVINLSLGGMFSFSLNRAVESAYNAGVSVAVAAGNENMPVIFTSPASAQDVITVGAIDTSDNRANFSNYGMRVDIFAPGVDILSTWIGDPKATEVLTGTSMASPHVAGLVAYLQSVEGLATPAEVSSRLTELATMDRISDARSPNRIAYNGNGQ